MQDPTKPIPAREAENRHSNKHNETSFKPGQSGNLNGRPPKNWTWNDLLEEVAEEYIELKDKNGESKGKQQYKKLVMKRLFQEAANGNIGAIKELMNRRDGMPQQKVNVEAQGNWNVSLTRDNA